MCFLLLTPKLNVPVLSPQGYNADFGLFLSFFIFHFAFIYLLTLKLVTS